MVVVAQASMYRYGGVQVGVGVFGSAASRSSTQQARRTLAVFLHARRAAGRARRAGMTMPLAFHRPYFRARSNKSRCGTWVHGCP